MKFKLKHRQIVFFLFAGVSSALVELLMMKVLSSFIPLIFEQETNFYGVKYPLSNIFSTLFSILVNYWLSIRFVFERGRYGKRREFLYFVVFNSATTLLSLSAFQFFIHYVFLSPIGINSYILSPIILSKIMAIGSVSILNYTVKKNVIFKG